MAINLTLLSSFDYNSADALAVNQVNGDLIIGRTSRVSEQPRITNPRVDIFTPNGQFKSSITSDEFSQAIGLSALPNGNFLLFSPNEARVMEFNSAGKLVPGGIDFVSSQLFSTDIEITDFAYDPTTNTLFASNNRPRSNITQFDLQGNFLGSIDAVGGPTTVPFRAIAIDSLTNNFLVVDDDDSNNSPYDNTVYEITRSGQVVGSVDIEALTGFADPEGIDINPLTRTLYLALDDDDDNGSKVYLQNRNKVLAFKMQMDTFTGDTGTNDSRTGDATTNIFLGGIGSDTLTGMEGDDVLDGGSDNDILNGNQGNDQVLCGSGNDFGRGGANNDYVGGNAGDDTLFGDEGNDTAIGDAGNDIINGNAGNDFLYGRDGNDLLRGGRGEDSIMGDAGNDTIMGDLGNDTLIGDEGNDILMGESGEDVLIGGVGKDTLTGGASRDTFVFSPVLADDVITDFVRGQDLIGLTGGLTFDQLTITQELVNNVASADIRISSTGQILATLNGVAAATLTRESFITI